MYYIKLLNAKNETFIKKYDSYYLFTKDIIKYKHVKNLKIVSFGGVVQ